MAKTFRKESRFDPTPIRRLSIGVLTTDGMEEFDLPNGFVDTPQPEIPFGPEVGGVKIRLRPTKPVFGVGEKIEFYTQAVNVPGKPVVWWYNNYPLSENITLEIDGKAVEFDRGKAQYVGGWAADHTCPTPAESQFALPVDGGKLGKGKHTLVYKLTSKPGTYRNTVGQAVPLLDGTLVSNEVPFEVK